MSAPMDEWEERESMEGRDPHGPLYQSVSVGTPRGNACRAVRREIQLGRCVWSPLISLVHRHRFVPYIDERWIQADAIAAENAKEGTPMT